MRIYSVLLVLFVMTAAYSQKSFYDLKAKTIDGADYDFAQLKGKKVLIVNTASKCGFTPQYADLEKLYRTFGGDDFVILGFPSNDFLSQEPGTESEIKNFCQVNYGVTFQMMSKVEVKGKSKHEVYQWLTQKALNGVEDSEVKWNFQKYLIDENGKLVKVLLSRTNPTDPEIVEWLK